MAKIRKTASTSRNKARSLGGLEWNFAVLIFGSSPLADEIAFLDGMTIVYKSSIDLFIYVVGSAQENEVE